MTATRRPATDADLIAGAIVYKGQGKTPLIVVATRTQEYVGGRIALGALTVRATSSSRPKDGIFWTAEKFTVEVDSTTTPSHASTTVTEEPAMTETIAPAVRFSAVRIDGRWKVQDAATGEAATAASRAKAEERAAKLNAAEERAGTTLQERSQAPDPIVKTITDKLYGDPETAALIEETASAPLEVVTLDGTETTVTVEETVRILTSPDLRKGAAEAKASEDRARERAAARAAELAEAVNAGTITFAEAAAKLPSAPTVPAEKAEPMKSLWVAAAFVPIILADEAPERATLVAKLDASVPNNRGGRTVRLTRAEAEELAAIGTEIENAAGGVGRNAHSARTMRARLAALWA